MEALASNRISDAFSRQETAQAGKFLTFKLYQEEYGIDILQIKEIIGLMSITAVPHTPNYLRGVINLRGKVIPVVDLRCRFGMSSTEPTERTCIIVVELPEGGGGKKVTGLVVDSVSEVLSIGDQDVEPPPGFGSEGNTDFIRGMAKLDGQVKILLDVERLFAADELQRLAMTTQ